MISTVSKAVHCCCKLNTKKMVNKLSVIGGYGCILFVYRLLSIVQELSSGFWHMPIFVFLYLL